MGPTGKQFYQGWILFYVYWLNPLQWSAFTYLLWNFKIQQKQWDLAHRNTQITVVTVNMNIMINSEIMC